METENGYERLVVDVEALTWRTRGDTVAGSKLLRLNEDFSYVSVTRAPAGVVAPGHVHIGPVEVFFLEGQVQTIAGKAGEGFWVLEPAGAMHRASESFPGETALSTVVALNHVKGPMAFLDADGAAPFVLYGEELKAIAVEPLAGKTLAERTAAMYPEDYPSGIVEIEAVPWVPSGCEGVWVRVLHVSEDGSYVLFVKGEDGAVVPPRRFGAPADFYVISGCLQFDDGTEAAKDHWVYEPAGAFEGPVVHKGETVYLGTFAGAVADLTPTGSIDRLVDGRSLRETLAVGAGR